MVLLDFSIFNVQIDILFLSISVTERILQSDRSLCHIQDENSAPWDEKYILGREEMFQNVFLGITNIGTIR